jgi:hypothetical protein
MPDPQRILKILPFQRLQPTCVTADRIDVYQNLTRLGRNILNKRISLHDFPSKIICPFDLLIQPFIHHVFGLKTPGPLIAVAAC